jgi:molybdopterin-biosynthesis enzyme MoeA-like protein
MLFMMANCPVSLLYMLDTTVFNALCDGTLSSECLIERRLIATGIQESELANTTDRARRNALRITFEQAQTEWVPAAQFVFGMAGAGWGQGSWGLDDQTHRAMLARLKELEGAKRGSNQVADVLIAETAMKHGAILVSGDYNLRVVASEFGVQVMSLNDFAR